MFGQNQVNLIGRIGNDPEVRTLQNGGKCLTMSVATDESYINRENGEKVKRTEWHRIVTFMPKLVERIEKLMGQSSVKGKLVMVQGSLRTRSWKKDGEESNRYTTEIVINPAGRFQLLERATEGGVPNGNGSQSAAESAPAPTDNDASATEISDDIPF